MTLSRLRAGRLTGLLAFIVVFALMGAGTAQALSGKVRNWPNSPQRHTLKQRLGETVPSFAQNLRGDVTATGNTLETCPQNLVASRRHHATGHSRRASSEPCLGNNNNDENMQYVNIDPGGNRFNSSTATLTLPTGARIVRAYLYWAADLSRGVKRPPNDATNDAPAGASPATNPLYTTAQLKAGGGAYSTINATAPGRDGRWDSVASWYNQPGQDPGWAYQVRADVTNEISAGLQSGQVRRRGANESLPVTVANVQAGTGYNRYAGWNLIVVWATPTAAFRNVTLFDGFDFVQVEGGQQLVVGPLDFTGFQTPPSGNVDAKVTVWATEGDRAITGDYLALGALSESCTGLPHESDAARPVDNFFNSSITAGGQTLGGRTPGYDNQLGFDLGTLNLPQGTIPNGATGASVCLGTVGDTYFFGGLAFSTLIKAPNLKIVKDVTPTSANPGEAVNYSTTVSNPSTRDPSDPLFGTPVDAATNLVIADQLPSGLDFVAFTSNPGGACTYVAADRTISCAVGRLDPDATFGYAYRATVNGAAQGDTPASLRNAACYAANSEDQPDVNFTGCDEASVLVPPAPTTDLGVVKTVSDQTIAPGGTLTWTVTGTNYGPATSTGFVLADQLPPNVAFVSATADPPLSCVTPAVGTSGAISCTAPSVPAKPASGSSLSVKIVATVPGNTANGTVLANVATVSGDQAEPVPDPHPNRDQALTTVVVPDTPLPPLTPGPTPVPEPNGNTQPPVPPTPPPHLPNGPAGTQLALRKLASPRVTSFGKRVSYTLRLTNIGNASALRVHLCDLPPRGLIIVSAPGLHRVGRSVCVSVGTLDQGHRVTYHLTARVVTGGPRSLRNRAVVLSANAPARRARATVVVVPRKPPPGRG